MLVGTYLWIGVAGQEAVKGYSDIVCNLLVAIIFIGFGMLYLAPSASSKWALATHRKLYGDPVWIRSAPATCVGTGLVGGTHCPISGGTLNATC